MQPATKTKLLTAITVAAAIAAVAGLPLGIMQVWPYTFRQLFSDLTPSPKNGAAAVPDTSARANIALRSSEAIPTSVDLTERAEADRRATANDRVTRYWRTVSKGDRLEKVFAILGEPAYKPSRDARTGKALNGVLIFSGTNGLSVNIWHENELVKDVGAAVFRNMEKRPEFVAANWTKIKINDSAESLLRRLGGPTTSVCYTIDNDEIADQLLIFEDGADLSVVTTIRNLKVTKIDAERR